MQKIMIVEDEQKLARYLELELTHEGYETRTAHDGRAAVALYDEWPSDLIILDLMLPELSGIEVCRRIRQKNGVPIIILTAKDDVSDKVMGLDMGADDYVTKPFAIEELLARIRVALKHGGHSAAADADEICQGKLVVNTRNRHVAFDGQEVALTKTEFDMLAYMAAHPDKVLSRDELLSEVWGYSYAGDTNIVDVYVRYLRQKAQYRHSPGAVNYRRTVRQAQQQQKTASYHHKCAVCGRTDTDYPDLQFRYCSKCAGYHCFCQDHIFSHVHFTEE